MANPIEGLKAMRIGCTNVVWAPLTKDDGTAKTTWGTPMNLPGVMVMNINPNVSIETAFYDDGPGDVASTLGNIEVSFDKSSLGPKEKATLLGKAYDAKGVLWHGSNDTPPWGAIGFKSLKSDGTYRYVWLYKGKFTEPADNNETKADSVNFQNDQIVGRFAKVNWEYSVTDDKGTAPVNGVKVKPWKIEIDTTTQAEVANLDTKWFTGVVEPDTTFTS